MMMTVTDSQLESILRKAVDYGEAIGAEGALVALGKVPRYMKRAEAMNRLGKRIYNMAVERGELIETKQNPDKANSPIVVERKRVIYVEKVLK